MASRYNHPHEGGGRGGGGGHGHREQASSEFRSDTLYNPHAAHAHAHAHAQYPHQRQQYNDDDDGGMEVNSVGLLMDPLDVGVLQDDGSFRGDHSFVFDQHQHHQQQHHQQQQEMSADMVSLGGGSLGRSHISLTDSLAEMDPARILQYLEDACVGKQQQHQQHHQQQQQVDGSAATAAGGGDPEQHVQQQQQQQQQHTQQQQQNKPPQQTTELLRRWLWAHPSVEDRQALAMLRGKDDACTIHFLCQLHNPPADVLQALLEAAPLAATITDSHGWLPLHLACCNPSCSTEIFRALCMAYPEGKVQPDHDRLRTPLHFFVTATVSSSIVGNSPQSLYALTTSTSTAQHHLTTSSSAAAAACAELLSDTGAAESADKGGMLPLHYACAYGTDPSVLAVLAAAYPDGLTAREHKGRAPLHLAMANAHHEASPAVVRFLLSQAKDTVNARDLDGYLPLHLTVQGFREKGSALVSDQVKRNVTECLTLYMEAEPFAAADFLTAIQDLPDWLQDTAVVSKHVRTVLNYKIVQPFPTMILMLDGYVLLTLIVSFGLATSQYIDFIYENHQKNQTSTNTSTISSSSTNTTTTTTTNFTSNIINATRNLGWYLWNDTSTWTTTTTDLDPYPDSYYYSDARFLQGAAAAAPTEDPGIRIELILLITGATYLLTRELVQMASLISLGSFPSWWKDPTNWLDVTVICTTYTFSLMMMDERNNDLQKFQAGAAITQGILYFAVIMYLKTTYVDFAVFVGGVLYVAQRLSAFLMSSAVILLAFGQMFFFMHVDTQLCNPEYVNQTYTPFIGTYDNVTDSNFDPRNKGDTEDCSFPFCRFDNSLLKVYAMMMGNTNGESWYSVGDPQFRLTVQLLFVFYCFFVIILLSNVLIAIVTDSYEVIQNDRSAIVFWSNRLDFVAEMDAIIYGAKQRLGCFRTDHKDERGRPMQVQETANGPAVITSAARTGNNNNNNNNNTNDMYGNDSYETFRSIWQDIVNLFDSNEFDEMGILEAWVYNVIRIFCILFLIPVWLVLGVVTAGWLWPPQVREALFVQKETATSRAEIERRKLEQLRSIQTDLVTLKHEIIREMTNDRDERMRLSAEVETVQSEVLSDLQQVRELLTSLVGGPPGQG